MAVPKYNEFFPCFLKYLADGIEHRLTDIRAFCADFFDLSEEDRKATIPCGKNKLSDRVGWARTHLKKAGLIQNPKRGVSMITPLGKNVLQEGTDILTLEYIHDLQVKNGEASPESTDTSETQGAQSPQEAIDIAVEQLKADLTDEILSILENINEYDFEQVVVDLLLKMGYGKPEENQHAVTKKSGDGGIDGIVRADRFGFDAVYIQAKRWKKDSLVPSTDIQKFLGAIVSQGATKGLFITTGQFSSAALNSAAKNPNHKIVLVDGKQLAELMIEYGLGVTTIKTYEIKRIDSDYFEIED